MGCCGFEAGGQVVFLLGVLRAFGISYINITGHIQ